MKKYLCCVCASLLLACLLSSCSTGVNEYAGVFRSDYLETNEIYYNYYSSKLLLLKDGDAGREENPEDLIQYPFLNNNAYFTSGSSTQNHFKILKLQGHNLQTVYEMPEADCALFPLDEFAGKLYFIKTTYLDNAPQSSVICVYEDGRLAELGGTRCQSITAGTILGGKLYYISIRDAQNRIADLMAASLGDPDHPPVVYKANTKSYFLFRFQDHLIYSDEQFIYAGAHRYAYQNSDYVSFLDSENVMIQSHETKEGEMILVYDLNTGALLKQFPYCDALQINEQEMKLLYSDGVKTYRWRS